MLEDRYGFALSTASAEARDAYVAGVDLSLSANHGAEEQFRRAIALDDGLAVAHAALARTLQVQHKPAEAKAAAARARELAAGLPHRERSHAIALGNDGRRRQRGRPCRRQGAPRPPIRATPWCWPRARACSA